jgi:hypothetical protein
MHRYVWTHVHFYAQLTYPRACTLKHLCTHVYVPSAFVQLYLPFCILRCQGPEHLLPPYIYTVRSFSLSLSLSLSLTHTHIHTYTHTYTHTESCAHTFFFPHPGLSLEAWPSLSLAAGGRCRQPEWRPPHKQAWAATATLHPARLPVGPKSLPAGLPGQSSPSLSVCSKRG